MAEISCIEKNYTYADLQSWNDEKRYEIIDGDLFCMNAPLRIHQKISFDLGRKLADLLEKRGCEVYLAPFDVRLSETKNEKEIINVVQPDISVICDKNKLDEKGCFGAPDLIVEVVSPSSASRDYVKKRRLYEKFGVKEYWIINPEQRFLQIQKLEGNKYVTTDSYASEEVVPSSIFPELQIDLSEIFPELPKVVCENPPPDYV